MRRSTWTPAEPATETRLDDRDFQPLSRRELRERERRNQRAAPRARAAATPTAALPSSAPVARGTTDTADTTATTDNTDTAAASIADLVAGASAPGGANAGGARTGSRGSAASGGAGRKSSGRPPKEPRKRRSRGQHRGAWILVIVLVVVLGGGTAGVVTAWDQVKPGVEALFGKKASDDYTGSGNGTKVQFTIAPGDIGSTIADKLAKADITKTAQAPYQLLLADQNISFQPGTYSMYKHMSASSAIARLQQTDARITTQLVIPEGTTLKGIIGLMESVTKLKAADIEAAAADYKSYGLPSNATGLEGYLFPATYDLQPGKTAHDYFQTMVDTMKQHLQADGVTPANYEHTVIFASLIQKEGTPSDFAQVARVFQNRIDQGMLLQSDATVAYGSGTTGTVTTTDAQREDASNKYNTYIYKGLPIGPISNPGDAAINAALHPAAGSWLYFVTVNLETGQTTFSDTYAEHEVAVAQFQSWLRAHPSYN